MPRRAPTRSVSALVLSAAFAYFAPEPAVARAGEGDWVVTYAVRHETPAMVAKRHGVTVDELIEWNGLTRDAKTGEVTLREDQRLRVKSKTFPPPRQRVKYRVREDDTVASIAERFGVAEEDLRGWNPIIAKLGKRPLRPKMRLMLWVDSGVNVRGSSVRGPAIPTIATPPAGQGLSIGKPYRGRIQDAVPLPPSEQYIIRFDRLAFGTATAVVAIQKAIASFRHKTGFSKPLYIGAMSRKAGRRLRPHKSHQSGRDVDVRLPAMDHSKRVQKLRSYEVDWHATWALIQAFVDTGVVKVIFLERKFFRKLRSSGVAMGATDEEVAAVMDGYVRHSRGHTAHIHVRFQCSDAATKCRD